MKYSIFIFLLFVSSLFSQTKNEKEERISPSEFPKKAIVFFSNNIAENFKHLKFYKETDGLKQSFEAKFKYKKQYCSIEYDTSGILEDIEIIIKKNQIEKGIKNVILNHFESNFKKYSFVKIQKQFVNNASHSDEEFITDVLNNTSVTPSFYEIIAEVKTETSRTLKEFTFNVKGEFESSRTVTLSSYEHALY